VLLTLALGLGLPVAAYQAQKDFQPATKLGEQLPAAPLVYAAYAFCWVALLAYVFMLWRRLGQVERELAGVHAKLKSRG
jgi:CcmD family protein